MQTKPTAELIAWLKKIFCEHDWELVAKCCNSDNRGWSYQMMSYLEPAWGWMLGLRICKKCGKQEFYAQKDE